MSAFRRWARSAAGPGIRHIAFPRARVPLRQSSGAQPAWCRPPRQSSPRVDEAAALCGRDDECAHGSPAEGGRADAVVSPGHGAEFASEEVGWCRTTWCWPAVGSSIRRRASTACATWGSTAARSRRSATRLDGATTVDVGGLVVAPGFVDLHSHAQTLPGRRLQACDGVTTALDLEAGRAPVELAYAREAKRGSPINYGFSASWAAARMHVIADGPLDGGAAAIFGGLVGTEWQQAATAAQVARILDQISTDLAAGAIGIGVLVGYTPGVDPAEYLAVAELAAAAGVPTFTHSRDIVELAPETLIDGAEEIVRAAGTTGAHMHYCHINSTSGRHIDRVLALVGRCQAEGARVTTEAYPYGSGSTAIGAAFLAPERLRERFRDTTSITYLRTGERIADDARLRELRATDPGGLVIAEFLDESEPERRRAAAAVPHVPRRDRRERRDAAPVDRHRAAGPRRLALAARGGHPPAHRGHVRARPAAVAGGGRAAHRGGPSRDPASCAGARGRGPRDAPQGPRAGRRGRRSRRVRRGTRDRPGDLRASTRPSSGIAHVIVGGTFVVRDGELVPRRASRPAGARPHPGDPAPRLITVCAKPQHTSGPRKCLATRKTARSESNGRVPVRPDCEVEHDAVESRPRSDGVHLRGGGQSPRGRLRRRWRQRRRGSERIRSCDLGLHGHGGE